VKIRLTFHEPGLSEPHVKVLDDKDEFYLTIAQAKRIGEAASLLERLRQFNDEEVE
jgi:hypothetical protein